MNTGDEEVSRVIACIQDSPRNFLLEILASLDSPEAVGKVLEDLLTEKELGDLEQRLKASLAFCVARVYRRPQTKLCDEMGLNYTTYKRASNIWKVEAGGLCVALEAACNKFSELEGLKSE